MSETSKVQRGSDTKYLLSVMISVVIPSFNRKSCIQALLRDVYVQVGANFEVIIVDDLSTDGTVEMVKKEFPQVKLLVNEANAGPCVTRNRGIQLAVGDLIVGLDSDVTLPDRHLFAKVLEAFARRPNASGFAFRILSADERSDDSPRWWHPISIQDGYNRSFETDYFSGTAYAFRRDVMIKAGLYPERLFMHYEEVELAFRILDGGGSIFYQPELQVVHHANPVSRRSEIQVFYKPRNQVLLALSCLPLWQVILFLTPRITFQFWIAVKNRHIFDYCRAMKSAVVEGRQLGGSRNPLKSGTLRRLKKLRAIRKLENETQEKRASENVA